MKRYHDLALPEKLALSHDDFTTAVKLEAIERGIKPPITLDNLLKQQPFVGYTIPPDSVYFYEVMVPAQYGEAKPSGLAFKTIEEARAAMLNAIGIYEDGYGADKRQKIVYGEFAVREVPIALAKMKTFANHVTELEQDTKDYDALVMECSDDLQKLRQVEYDMQVLARKRAEYLSLAGGDVEIAKRFWSKTERTEFPPEAQAA